MRWARYCWPPPSLCRTAAANTHPNTHALYAADARALGEVLLATPERPPWKLILEKLNEAKPDMQRRVGPLGCHGHS